MPISRYEIRNEYTLADPELYRAADKDDPEALLEGVAMAGLVGFLRQLGDLAEFAAEIFHNLHEEVMATAARGHGLMSRVQQLESEIPSIERAFLSQTDHSSYFKQTGIDWHPNLRVDQNIVTKGDLPRFVRDSYEECRPPPRLFLLDKFDVGGAGACLKRFTDPSFFKVETSGMTKADVMREKKIRRPKKKGSGLRNGGTPADLSSHTKLHQLFMEERIQTVASYPTHRAKLKRKLNGFPFNTRTEASYMEKLLNYPPVDNEVVHKVPLNSSHLTFPTFDRIESGLEVVEVLPVSPDGDLEGRKRSPPSSPDGDEIMLNSSIYKSGEVTIDDTICEVPDMYPNIATRCRSSTPDREAGEKVIAMDGESSLNGSQSEDIASEVDNYVDAPSTVESDADVDTRLQIEGLRTTSHIKNEFLISYASSENLQTGTPDSRSTISGEVNISSMLFSDSPSTSYENPQPRRISAEGFLSAVIPEAEAENFPVEQHPESVAEEGMVEVPTSDKRDSNLDDEENKSNLVMDPPCLPCVSEFDIQSGDKCCRSSAREHQVDDLDSESTQSKSTVLYAHNHMQNSSNRVTSSVPDWDGSEQEDKNLSEKGTPNERTYSENVIPGISENACSMNAEDSHLSISVDNQVALDNILFSAQAKPSDWLDAITNAHEGDVIPEEEKMKNEACALETLRSFDVVGPIDTEIKNYIGTDDSEAQGGSYCKPKYLKETAETSDDVEIDIITRCTSFTRQEVTENSGPDDLISLNEGHVLLDEHHYKTSDTDMGSSTHALLYNMINVDIPFPVGTNELVEQHVNFSEDSRDEIDHVKSPLSRNNEESSLVEELDQAKASLSDSEIILSDNNDNIKGDHKSEISTAIPNSHCDWGLKLESPETIHFPMEKSFVNGEHKIPQCMSDSPCLLSDHKNEEFAFVPVQLNRMSIEVPAMLPTNNQEIVDHDDCTKDQLVSTLPSNNPFLHTNQINLADLPPLPPLPPVQWRLGKLQPPLSSSEEDSIKNEPLFPLLFSHPVVPTDDATSYDDYPLHEGTKKPRLLILGESRPEDEKVEDYFRAEVKDAREMGDLSPKSENKQQELDGPTSGGESTSAVEEDGDADTSQAWKLSWPLIEGGSCAEAHTSCETVDLLPKSENKQQELVMLPASGGESSSAAKEYESENNSQAGKSPRPLIEEGSRAEVNAVNEIVDLSPRSENKQQELILPISRGESPSAPEEYGSANGSRAGKLPLPRNPIIDEFSAVDKIKLRKVTDQVRPQIQKVNERDLFLQQIRTKSFNLRPASTSRPSVRGPSTNLRVAAIVEKANAIRQALADSDEDDDSWSDS